MFVKLIDLLHSLQIAVKLCNILGTPAGSNDLHDCNELLRIFDCIHKADFTGLI